jgi:predicted TIM-barrel fold metal-dependent hydrolase
VRGYNPTPATLAQYNAMASALGLQRVVFVQPSAYGTDNSCMIDALRARSGTTRGIAVINSTTSESQLDEMAALGVKGVRLNLVSNGIPDPEGAAHVLRDAAARIAPRGWHVQIFVPGTLLQAIAPIIPTLSVPVVIDHMGGTDARLGLDQPGLPALIALLQAGKAWVKISGANRVSRQETGFRDALPVMRALVAANPARAVWGTDWPHIGPHDVGAPKTVIYMQHDNVDLLRILGEAVPDAAHRHAILVDNPAQLYGF